MRLRNCLAALPLAALACAPGGAPEPAAVDTRAIVEHLADDALEGRLTGSAGIRKAADYIIGELQANRGPAAAGPGRLPPGVQLHGRRHRRRRERRDHPRRRDAAAAARRRRTVRPRPVVLRQRHGRRSAGVRRLRTVGAGDGRLQLRQLCDARRGGQDRGRPALFPRGHRGRRARHAGALRRAALQGARRARAGRRRPDRGDRPALAQCRRTGSRSRSTRP